jgi:hypothetical protein
MGVVRALVVIILIAVAASPLVSGKLGLSADVPSVYADFSSVSVQQKHPERDKEKKDQNRDSDEDEKGNREKTSEEKKAEKDNLEEDDDAPRNVTNALSEDNFAIEGWVIALNCAAEPKEIGSPGVVFCDTVYTVPPRRHEIQMRPSFWPVPTCASVSSPIVTGDGTSFHCGGLWGSPGW